MSTDELLLPEKETLKTQSHLADLEEKWLKLRIADHARLLADNQKVLTENSRQLARDSDYESRVAETAAKKQLGEGFASSPSSELSGQDDDVKINIDSPTTITYHVPAGAESKEPVVEKTPAPSTLQSIPTKAAVSLGKLALVAALSALGGGGLSALIPWLISDKPVVSTPAADTDTTRRVEVSVEHGEP